MHEVWSFLICMSAPQLAATHYMRHTILQKFAPDIYKCPHHGTSLRNHCFVLLLKRR